LLGKVTRGKKKRGKGSGGLGKRRSGAKNACAARTQNSGLEFEIVVDGTVALQRGDDLAMFKGD